MIFAGTPDVAVPTLAALANSSHEVVGAVTRPPARQGRSSRLVPSPVAEFALAHNIPLLETSAPSSPESLDWIEGADADLGVVVAYGALLRPDVLEAPRLGWINLHFSALPDLRGAAPVQRAILRGDVDLATSVFLLDEGMDTGPVISTVTRPVSAGATSGEALALLAQASVGQVMEAVADLEDGIARPIPQNVKSGSIAPKLSKRDGLVSFQETARQTVDRVRAVTPAPGAWTTAPSGQPMKLRAVSLDPVAGGPAQPGAIELDREGLRVRCADSWVRVGQVAPAGKTWMNAADWARGARLEPNDRLGAEPNENTNEGTKA